MLKLIRYPSFVLGFLLLIASLVPLIPSDQWYVRVADFPRAYVMFAALALGVLLVVTGWRTTWSKLLGIALLVASAMTAYTLWEYRPSGEDFVEACPADDQVSVMIANVLMTNRTVGPLVEMVEQEKPDLFLAMETDSWWEEQLGPLSATMPHTISQANDRSYGITLYSRMPLIDPQIIYPANQNTPAIDTGFTMASGREARFVGIHPKPPKPAQDSTGRDAQLLAAATMIAQERRPTILAGDLNAPPWGRTVELMERVGGLIDPREGYGYVATWHAKIPVVRWPLDHVMHRSGFATMSIERLPKFGSDHFPLLMKLCKLPDGRGDRPAALEDGDMERARDIVAKAEKAGAQPDGSPLPDLGDIMP